MNKIILILFSLFLSVICYAIEPTEKISITSNNIKQFGFNLEIRKDDELSSVFIKVPAEIDKHWAPDTIRISVLSNDETIVLNKIHLGTPTQKARATIFYFPKTQDINVGVFFVCVLESYCQNEDKLYVIDSVNNYLSNSD